MKAATFKLFERVHSWTGLLAGLALFIAFYAGAFTVFHEQIEYWQHFGSVDTRDVAAEAQSLVQSVTARYPDARKEVGVTIPSTPDGEVVAYWYDGKNWQERTAEQMGSPSPPAANATPEGTDLAHFVYDLHYTLAIPDVGIYLMGVVSVIYVLALITGVILYLPGLTKDLFALRTGKNLKRLWQDAHNVIGVLSLPFHIIFAVTGAIFCLSTVVVLIFISLVFKGHLNAALERTTGLVEFAEPRGAAAGPMLSPQAIIDRAREAVRERGGAPFEPSYIRYRNYGDVAATAEALGDSAGALASYGGVAFSAVDGKLLAIQTAGVRDANHATYSSMYGLHFGHFGHFALRWVYFALGLAGAFLFYSGNLLWIESRRNRRTPQQTAGSFVMARMTVAICIGTCVGTSATFLATLIAAVFGATSNGIVTPVFVVTLAACLAWSFARPPARAAADLLIAAAVITAAVPLTDIALAVANIRPALRHGDPIGITAVLLAAALSTGFALLARATIARARDGDVNSVWTGRSATPRSAPSASIPAEVTRLGQ
jgi:uncharacterized iron-regulated membrane protein